MEILQAKFIKRNISPKALQYGKIEQAPALSQSLRTRLPWRAATLLFPYKGTTTPEVAFSFDGRRAEIQHPEVGRVSVECSLPR